MGGDSTGDQISCQSSRLPCGGGIQREHQHLVCTPLLLLRSPNINNFTSMECDGNQRNTKELYLEAALAQARVLLQQAAQRADTSPKFKQIHAILRQRIREKQLHLRKEEVTGG